jgi:hypothetical protein
MPYGHGFQSNKIDLLYVSNITVKYGSSNPYRMKTDFSLGDHVYMDDDDARVTSLPEILIGRQIVAIVTRDSDRDVPNSCQDHLKFRVSCDADVFVCYDTQVYIYVSSIASTLS